MKKSRNIVSTLGVVTLIILSILQGVVAQMPSFVSVMGTVKFSNGTSVPHGWNVTMENLNETYPDEPWTTTTGVVQPCYNYSIDGMTLQGGGSTFIINVSDPLEVYIGSMTFVSPGGFPIYNLTVYPIGDGTDPITNVTKPPEFIEPIPSGTLLNWTEENVTLTFERTDPAPAVGVNYTNLSASEEIANVNVSGWITAIPQVGTGNLTINTIAFGAEFNVTISNECNTTIYYYSVDKNMTPNVEVPKSVTVRIDRSEPLLCNATATPSTIVVNVTNTTLRVDVTDRYSNIAGNVTVNLTSIGGPWNATMECYGYYIVDSLNWSIRFRTNVSVTSEEYLGDRCLPVNVSDTLRHYNDTVCIPLKVIKGVPATNLTAVWNQTDNTTNVSWNGTVGAPYDVYLATNKSGPFEIVTTVNALSWIDANATNSTLRLYRVNLTGYEPNPNMTAGKFNFTIYDTWNMISIPLLPDNTSIGAVICSGKAANDDRIFSYSPVAGLKSARYWNGWSGTLTSFDSGVGYWYWREVSDELNMTVAGRILVDINTTIYSTWNLVGYASVAPSGLSIVDDPDYDDRIYKYSPITGLRTTRWWDEWDGTLVSFEPGSGYWYWRQSTESFYWTYTDI